MKDEDKLSFDEPIEFTHWIFHSGKNRLINQQTDISIELEYKVSSLLFYFCNHSKTICSKEALIDALWPDRVVNDDSLNVAVSKLRKQLNDSARSPTYIKTIPGRGYQFLPDVRQQITTSLVIKKTRKKPAIFIVALTFLVLITAGSWLLMSSTPDKLNTSSILSAEQKARFNRAIQDLSSVAPQKDNLHIISSLKELISQQPDYGPAYTALLRAKYRHVEQHYIHDLALYQAEFSALADKALSLDPDDAFALLIKARIAMFIQWDFEKAAHYYRRAYDLSPNDYEIARNIAEFLFSMGLTEQGLTLVNSLRNKKPELFNSPAIPYLYLVANNAIQAKREIKAQLQSQAPTEMHLVVAQRIGLQVGDLDMASSAFFDLLPMRGFNEQDVDALRKIYDESDMKGVFAHLFATKEQRLVGQYHPPLSFARYALLSNQPEKAMPYIEQAFTDKYVGILWLDRDPLYKPVKQIPAFKRLVEKLNAKRSHVSNVNF